MCNSSKCNSQINFGYPTFRRSSRTVWVPRECRCMFDLFKKLRTARCTASLTYSSKCRFPSLAGPSRSPKFLLWSNKGLIIKPNISFQRCWWIQWSNSSKQNKFWGAKGGGWRGWCLPVANVLVLFDLWDKWKYVNQILLLKRNKPTGFCF